MKKKMHEDQGVGFEYENPSQEIDPELVSRKIKFWFRKGGTWHHTANLIVSPEGKVKVEDV
jgi:hypothetical protein